MKSLASQTAKATEEISTQIAGMQSATQESVSAIKQIGNTIGEISGIASEIASAVEQQGAATREIARTFSALPTAPSRSPAISSMYNRGATETGAASAQVLNSAQTLSSESASACRARSVLWGISGRRKRDARTYNSVMPGLVPGIHHLRCVRRRGYRVKPSSY